MYIHTHMHTHTHTPFNGNARRAVRLLQARENNRQVAGGASASDRDYARQEQADSVCESRCQFVRAVEEAW